MRTDRTYCSVSCAARARERRGERILVFGDAHIPHLDLEAWSILLQLIGIVRPTWVISNGDFLDCYQLSKFLQPGSPGPGFPYEVEEGTKRAEELRAATSSRITFIEGNHEFRFKSWLNSREGSRVKGAKRMSIPEQLELDRLKIEWIECLGEKWFTTKIEVAFNLWVGHFSKVNQWSAYAAKNIQDRFGASFITGHNHSAGVVHRTTANGPIWGYEGGCMCRLDPPYCDPQNWAQAIHVIHVEDGETEIERVIINEGRARYGGRLLTA